jgi:hypothetical protein
MTPEGRPANEAYYLPETAPDPAVVLVPETDHLRIEPLVAGRPSRSAPAPVDPADVPLYDASAVAWHWAGRTLPADAYRGSVTLVEPLPPIAAGGREHLVWARVENAGTARWPWGWDRPPLIRLGVHWRDSAGRVSEAPARSMLTHTLDPGEDAMVPVQIPAPEDPGRYELMVDLVHEKVRWFDVATPVPVDVGPSAAARLKALRERHGAVAPVADVREIRAALGRHNALANDLLHQPMTPARSLEPELAAAVAGIEPDASTLDEGTLAIVADIVRRKRPAAILEFGSGVSTVVLAYLLRDLAGAKVGRLVSLDEDPHVAKKTRDLLTARGLEQIVSVFDTPIGPVQWEGGDFYQTTKAVHVALKAAPPELVLVNGPSPGSGASRVGAVEFAGRYLRRTATLLLHDAFRDAELLVADAWGRDPGVSVEGIALDGKGLLVGQIEGSSARSLLRRLWRGVATPA